MLLFLSTNYFGSRNCLREIKASIEQEKPLVLVQEQQKDKGGGPLDTLKAECRDDQMRGEIFNGRTPIVWHRISHFQNLSLKLIATEMLRQGPAAAEELALNLPGEINVSEATLPRPLVLWCSAGNPGAVGIAKELATSMASNSATIRVVESQPDVMQALEANDESVAMLLYLNKDTWVEQGEVLERDLRTAREMHAGLKIILVHENDKTKGGCEFATLFVATPQELVNDGIYRYTGLPIEPRVPDAFALFKLLDHALTLRLRPLAVT